MCACGYVSFLIVSNILPVILPTCRVNGSASTWESSDVHRKQGADAGEVIAWRTADFPSRYWVQPTSITAPIDTTPMIFIWEPYVYGTSAERGSATPSKTSHVRHACPHQLSRFIDCPERAFKPPAMTREGVVLPIPHGNEVLEVEYLGRGNSSCRISCLTLAAL